MNDYLARRDSEWVGQVHRFLGLRVGLVQTALGEAERQDAYRADVTYVTNSELGFDYLRDNLASVRGKCCLCGPALRFALHWVFVKTLQACFVPYRYRSSAVACITAQVTCSGSILDWQALSGWNCMHCKMGYWPGHHTYRQGIERVLAWSAAEGGGPGAARLQLLRHRRGGQHPGGRGAHAAHHLRQRGAPQRALLPGPIKP